MRQIWWILKDDLRNLYHNPASLVVVGALLVLPSLYAWFNIWYSWDPYGRTDGIEIAVASEDTGSTIRDEDINAGDEVINQLADNDELGWRFMSKDKVIDGVKKGDYYAGIVIPKDFSQHLASVLDKDIETPELDYYINEKVNAISPKITDKGASSIADSISENFVAETNNAVLTIFDDAGVELGENYDDIEKIRDGIFELEDKMPSIYSDLEKVQNGFDLGDEAVDDVRNSLDNVDDLHERMSKLNLNLQDRLKGNKKDVHQSIGFVSDQLRNAQKSFQEVPDRTSSISDKGEDLDKVISKLRSKQGDLDDASARLQDVADFLKKSDQKLKGSSKIANIQDALDTNTSDLDELQDDINDVIDELENGDKPASDVLDKFSKRLDNVSGNVDDLYDDYQNALSPELKETQDSLSDLKDDLDDRFDSARERNDNISDKVHDLRDNADDLETDELQDKLEDISTHIATNQDWVKNVTSKLEGAEDLLEDNDGTLSGFIDRLDNLQDTLENAQSKVDAANKAIDEGEELGSDTFDDIESSLEDIRKGMDQGQDQFDDKAKGALDNAGSKLDDLDERVEDRFDRFQDLGSDLEDVKDEVSNKLENPKIALGVLKNAEKGIGNAKNAVGSVDDNLGDLNDVIQKVDISKEVEGIQATQDRLQDAKSSINHVINRIVDAKEDGSDTLDRIDQKASKIDDSLGDMIGYIDNDVQPKYDNLIDDSISGLAGLHDTFDRINDKTEDLRDLADRLDGKLSDGKEKVDDLADKFPDAEGAVNQATDKVRDLEEKGNLDELIDLLRNDPERISDFIANPVKLNEEKMFPVPNYGSAMNPFYTTLAFWVGGLLLISTLKPDRRDKLEFKSHAMYLSRLIIFSVLGIIQALIATLGNLWMLHTYVAHPVAYVLFGLFIGMIFVAIAYSLVSVFGNVGKVLTIVLLVIQIGGSGGTYPIEMTPDFFQFVNGFLPFTHGIDLLRESVGGIIWSVVWTKIAYLSLYLIIAILLGIFGKKLFNRTSDKFAAKAEESDFVL